MKIALLLITLLISACASQAPRPTAPISTTTTPPSFNREEALNKGFQLLSQRSPKKAIEQYFDKVIEDCSSLLSGDSQRVFTSRSLLETVYYMSQAASTETAAITVDSLCSDALYLKGYANLDMGHVDTAESLLTQAVALAPANALYLSELGHIHHVKRDWDNALATFTQAEKFAEQFSPEDLKKQELGRAKRGVGFSLIELGKLDAAKAKFKECLHIDPTDKAALSELKYIDKLIKESAAR